MVNSKDLENINEVLDVSPIFWLLQFKCDTAPTFITSSIEMKNTKCWYSQDWLWGGEASYTTTILVIEVAGGPMFAYFNRMTLKPTTFYS